MDQAREALGPLHMIFWGALLVLFDFHFSQTTNGSGWRFDIFNDLLGTILIAIGLVRLLHIPVGDSYRLLLRICLVAALVASVRALDGHFIYARPEPLAFVGTAASMITFVAIILFFLAMRLFAEHYDLPRSRHRWTVALWLFAVVYVIPLGLLTAAALVTGTSHMNIELFPLLLVAVVIFVIPIIYAFVATAGMRREIDHRHRSW